MKVIVTAYILEVTVLPETGFHLAKSEGLLSLLHIWREQALIKPKLRILHSKLFKLLFQD
jgi:hypothetical protein